MIENIIKQASDHYYKFATKEQFIADLRKAGFKVYDQNESRFTHLNVSYRFSSIDLTQSTAINYSVTQQLTEKISIPSCIYKILQPGSGEFYIEDVA